MLDYTPLSACIVVWLLNMTRVSSWYLTEFQSHEPEFDYLKSVEIEEGLNQVGGRLMLCCIPVSAWDFAWL
jgi:hypothetical protein